jgi:hypothetical protein
VDFARGDAAQAADAEGIFEHTPKAMNGIGRGLFGAQRHLEGGTAPIAF